MPDGSQQEAHALTCAFVQFQELYRHQAHTVGHLTTCDAFAELGVACTLYMMEPLDRPTPTPEQLAAEFDLRVLPRIAWVPHAGNRWAERARALADSAHAGRSATFTYSTRALPTLGALLGGAPQAVLEVHVPPSHWSKHDRLAFALARRSSRLRVVAISARLADIVAHESGLDRDRIIVGHSAHNFEIRDDYQAETGRRRVRVLYVGSFQAGKGVDLVYELARRLPDLDFLAVGGDADGQALPVNMQVSPRVPLAEVPALLASADVLLMPFGRYAGTVPEALGGEPEIYYSPRKMGEYLAAGRPIVAADLPSITEVMIDGRNCLIAEPDSVDAWAEAVARLAEDPALRERLAHSAAQSARELTTVARAHHILDALGVTP